MSERGLLVPKHTVLELHEPGKPNKPTAPFQREFDSMRRTIEEVLRGSASWEWTSEVTGETQPISRIPDTAQEWLDTLYNGSDSFSQRLAARHVTKWLEVQNPNFRANGKKPFPHQKALFAWLTIMGICNGNPERPCTTLLRSPYQSGKSLVVGMSVDAFFDLLMDYLADGTIDQRDIPAGVWMALRKELLYQNGLGGLQYAVQRPPYVTTVPRARLFWKQLELLYGKKFSDRFPNPRSKNDPWHKLFNPPEEGAQEPDFWGRIDAYHREQCEQFKLKGNADPPSPLSETEKSMLEIARTMRLLMNGEVMILPDGYQNPRIVEAPPRIGHPDLAEFGGDSLYAARSEYTTASHRDLLPNPADFRPNVYPRTLKYLAIVSGTAMTRPPERMRGDLRELAKRCQIVLLDEGIKGRQNPDSLGDAIFLSCGRYPNTIGCTGYDSGVEGWEQRSPMLKNAEMIRLLLTRPIAFWQIGSGALGDCFAQGSEEAWEQFRAYMFREARTAAALGQKQAHECNAFYIVPTRHVREYWHRIVQAHREEGYPADDIWPLDAKAGDARYDILQDRFSAPMKSGDPPRKLVASIEDLARGFSVPVECIYLLANVSDEQAGHLLGRLYGQRNFMGTEAERKRRRTYFIQQLLAGGRESQLRVQAKEMDIEIDDTDGQWVPLQCAIDRQAKKADDARRGLSEPEPIADALPPGKNRMHGMKVPKTPLTETSPFVIAATARREQRKMKRRAQKALDAAEDIVRGSASIGQDITVTVEFPIMDDGLPSPDAIECIAAENDLHAWKGAIMCDARSAFDDGARGTALADAVASSVARLRMKKHARGSE